MKSKNIKIISFSFEYTLITLSKYFDEYKLNIISFDTISRVASTDEYIRLYLEEPW